MHSELTEMPKAITRDSSLGARSRLLLAMVVIVVVLSVAVPALASDIHTYSDESNPGLSQNVWRESNTATQNDRWGGDTELPFGDPPAIAWGESVVAGPNPGAHAFSYAKWTHGPQFGYTRCRWTSDISIPGSFDIFCRYFHAKV